MYPFHFQYSKDSLTPEDGTNTLSRNVGNKLPIKTVQTSEKSEDLNFNVEEAQSLALNGKLNYSCT
jgi:hypothetical protein